MSSCMLTWFLLKNQPVAMFCGNGFSGKATAQRLSIFAISSFVYFFDRSIVRRYAAYSGVSITKVMPSESGFLSMPSLYITHVCPTFLQYCRISAGVEFHASPK